MRNRRGSSRRARSMSWENTSSSEAALLSARQALPIWSCRKALVMKLAAHTTLILTGETGCGKTTQIPQFLHAAGYTAQGLIGITQPRRVAAISVAARVAAEMGVGLGGLVGYAVRFDEQTSRSTRITYMTDGMLLREAMADPQLADYSVLIVDEAHERSLQTDVILALLKVAQAGRAGSAWPLRIIVMSATLEVDLFCAFFGDAPAVQVLGRAFPVQLFYVAEAQHDYLEAAVKTVLQIHVDEADGDILVFLTGQDDIEAVAAAIEQRAALLPADAAPLLPLPLYAALSAPRQLEALKPAPPGCRKAILATNIAETSVTIDGVVYVVDSGLVKSKVFHSARRLDSLLAMPISRAAARQRAGRAGRQCAGKCFRLYTEELFFSAELQDTATPEILRRSLSGTLLSLKALGIADVLSFDFLQPPSREALAAALEELLALGALDKQGELAEEGRLMARLPLDPSYAKALLAARGKPCVSHMLALLATLCADGALFYAPYQQHEAADEARKRFASTQGDSLTAIAVFAAYDAAAGRGGADERASRKWCEAHFLNWRTLEAAAQIRAQLQQAVGRIDSSDALAKADDVGSGAARASPARALEALDVHGCRELRRCLAAAFFMQCALRQPGGDYLAVVSKQLVVIHPSSVLFSRRANCVLFNELIFTSRLYMRELTQVSSEWLPELAPHFFVSGAATAIGRGMTHGSSVMRGN